jgi:hypothetical protein
MGQGQEWRCGRRDISLTPFGATILFGSPMMDFPSRKNLPDKCVALLAVKHFREGYFVFAKAEGATARCSVRR